MQCTRTRERERERGGGGGRVCALRGAHGSSSPRRNARKSGVRAVIFELRRSVWCCGSSSVVVLNCSVWASSSTSWVVLFPFRPNPTRLFSAGLPCSGFWWWLAASFSSSASCAPLLPSVQHFCMDCVVIVDYCCCRGASCMRAPIVARLAFRCVCARVVQPNTRDIVVLCVCVVVFKHN